MFEHITGKETSSCWDRFGDLAALGKECALATFGCQGNKINPKTHASLLLFVRILKCPNSIKTRKKKKTKTPLLPSANEMTPPEIAL